MRRVWVVFLMGLVALGAQAQKTNLSGTWKLNIANSFLGSDHPFPEYALTKTIVQTGDSIVMTDVSVHNSVVNIPLPDETTKMELVADGKQHEVMLPGNFPGMPGAKAAVTAEWQGGTLEIMQVVSGLANYSKNRFFLSPDGAQLIELVEAHQGFGDAEQRLVFERAS